MWENRKIASVLWLGTRSDQNFPRWYHPSSHSHAWNFDLSFRRRARNNADVDAAKFQRDWSTFEICFNFPERSTLPKIVKNTFRVGNFVPPVGFGPNDPTLDLGTITWARLAEEWEDIVSSSSGARARVGWSGTWYSFSGLCFLGPSGAWNFFRPGHLPGGVVRGLGEFFLRRGACGWAVPASATCLRPWVCAGKRGGTNRSDIGLNLSGSWQQGHSATYNTPSRT